MEGCIASLRCMSLGLFSHNVPTGAMHAELEEQIPVRVTTMCGAELDVEVPASCNLGQLKERLAAKLDIPPVRLALVCEGEMPEDDSLVCNCESSADGSRSLAVVVSQHLEVNQCLKSLEDEKETIRVVAIRHLGALGAGAATATDALGQLLQEGSSGHVRVEAVRALGEIGHHMEMVSPALFEYCKTDPCDEAVQEAFVRIGGPSVPFLVQLLEETLSSAPIPKPHCRGLLTTVAQMGEAAVPAMLDLERIMGLEQTPADIRVEAAAAIGKMGKCAIPTLCRFLRHGDWGVRRRASDALVAMSGDAVPFIMRAAADTTCVERVDMTAALGQFGSVARCGLENLAKSRDIVICAAATKALGKIGCAASIPVLAELLMDGDWDVRVAATEALGKMGDLSMTSLAQAVKVEYWAVQDMLLRVLEEMGETAVPLIESFLLGPELDLQFRLRCVDTLGKIGPRACQAVGTLIKLLAPTNPPIQIHAAVGALAKIGPASARAAAALADVLGRPSMCERTRELAADTLGQLGVAAVEPLAHCLESESPLTRKLAVSMLGRVGVGAVIVLQRTLAHPEAGMRQDAAGALGAIGPDAACACSALALLLRDADPWVRYEAVVALGQMGHAAVSVVAILTQALGDCNGCTAAAAAHALSKVGVETESVVAALVAAQALAQRTSNPGLASACLQAQGHLAFASEKRLYRCAQEGH